ncbi:scarecrow-like protein 21 [Mangifera indica]|uniref:scarecrow-like protein 21 n=1 Tax=Mangifera indica TaxID=29780 RepID=UPI001CFB9768|nr:scarecrow-like protein 21 [Mangifera indica]
MDSHQLFGLGVSSGGLSYSSSHPTVPSVANRLMGSLKFDIKNSPNSPFSSQFECDAVTTLSESQEHQSSPQNLSVLSPSCNSSLESSSYYRRLSPSVDSLALYPGGTSYVERANCSQKMEYFLQELETELMAPDGDKEATTPNGSYGESSSLHESGHHRSRASWRQSSQSSHVIQPQPSVISRYRPSRELASTENQFNPVPESSLQGFPSGNLKQLLIACAKALSENNINDFDNLIAKARGAVSISGEPIQRLGAYMVEGLVARKEKSGSNIYHALRCREPDSKDLLSYMHILYEICPYLKFGYMAANGAIAEVCKHEDRIHIVDFQIAQGTQWMTLLQALAAKPSGSPHVRITGIDDPVSKYARGYGLEAVGKRLAAISQKFNIPLEFHPVPVFAPKVTMEMLDVRPGEALVVNFPLQLHHTPDESVDVNNPRDGLLRKIKSLNPKVVTLVEQESNTNTAAFLPRFVEALNYYLAMFESIDVTMPRDQKQRINVEQHCLARDIVNVIACEGRERVERHELFGKWKSRFTMAGFRQCPLSPYVNSVIKSLLRCYSEHYRLVETDGAMLLGWKDRALISASAWC